MARMRSVKPEFFLDEELASLTSRDARLTYIGMWTLSDEHGRLRGDARYIKGQLFMYDDDLSAADVDQIIEELVKAGKAVRYRADGSSYLYLPNLARHQRLDSDKVPTRLPAPPGFDDNAPVPGPSENFPDESGNGANMFALSRQHVAGGIEHVAGAKIPAAAAAMIRTVVEATGATEVEAAAVIELVRTQRAPRNLGAFLRRLAVDEDLGPFLADVRKISAKTVRAAALVAARDGPPCEHGQPGGAELHPDSGEPWCVSCRMARRRREGAQS